jgi:hypothetical protein
MTPQGHLVDSRLRCLGLTRAPGIAGEQWQFLGDRVGSALAGSSDKPPQCSIRGAQLPPTAEIRSDPREGRPPRRSTRPARIMAERAFGRSSMSGTTKLRLTSEGSR